MLISAGFLRQRPFKQRARPMVLVNILQRGREIGQCEHVVGIGIQRLAVKFHGAFAVTSPSSQSAQG